MDINNPPWKLYVWFDIVVREREKEKEKENQSGREREREKDPLPSIPISYHTGKGEKKQRKPMWVFQNQNMKNESFAALLFSIAYVLFDKIPQLTQTALTIIATPPTLHHFELDKCEN